MDAYTTAYTYIWIYTHPWMVSSTIRIRIEVWALQLWPTRLGHGHLRIQAFIVENMIDVYNCLVYGWHCNYLRTISDCHEASPST
jgi:hypothetical protein